MADEYKRIALSFETHAALKAEKETRGVTWQKLFEELLELAKLTRLEQWRLREGLGEGIVTVAEVPSEVTASIGGLAPEELREQLRGLLRQVPEYQRQGEAFKERVLDEWLGKPV